MGAPQKGASSRTYILILGFAFIVFLDHPAFTGPLEEPVGFRAPQQVCHAHREVLGFGCLEASVSSESTDIIASKKPT